MFVSDEKILQEIKRKQSPAKSAERLGISEEEYITRRSEVVEKYGGYKRIFESEDLEIITENSSPKEQIVENINLDTGKGSYSGLISNKPLAPHEIEKKYKIDKTKWRLSSYWNKEQPNGKFLVSANVTQLQPQNIDPLQILNKILSTYKFKYEPHRVVEINKSFTNKTCAVLSLQDLHIGKETIETDNIVLSAKECVQSLVMRSYHSNYLDKIVFVLGGDLINMDTYLGTTTSGTPVENSLSAYDAYKTAFDLMFWMVNYLKQFCQKLEVVYIPGNHSRLSEAHLAYSLSKCIQDENIIWNVDYEERKVVIYGNSMLCFEHGDSDLRKSLFVFATEFSSEWGATKYRTLYTGHYHKGKKVEYITEDELNGFTIKTLPSLCKTDSYHYKNKWTGNKRGGIIELHSQQKGQSGAFNYYE